MGVIPCLFLDSPVNCLPSFDCGIVWFVGWRTNDDEPCDERRKAKEIQPGMHVCSTNLLFLCGRRLDDEDGLDKEEDTGGLQELTVMNR